jgi:hypothetical protein
MRNDPPQMIFPRYRGVARPCRAVLMALVPAGALSGLVPGLGPGPHPALVVLAVASGTLAERDHDSALHGGYGVDRELVEASFECSVGLRLHFCCCFAGPTRMHGWSCFT